MSLDAMDLSHHFLIAMPEMTDPVFAGTVTYIFQHDTEGAMGLIINRQLKLEMNEIFDSVAIEQVSEQAGHQPVYHGGPVSSEQGFILHRPTEQVWKGSIFNNHLAVTSSLDILEAIAEGQLVGNYLFCLGYSGWSKGQLESELKQNAWLTVAADSDIIFGDDDKNKYRLALALLGIDQSSLAGHGGLA